MRVGDPQLLTPAEVALLFRVEPKTVTRWANAGKLASIRTLGGHRRFAAAAVLELLENHHVASDNMSVGLEVPDDRRERRHERTSW